jgi:ankyrin repeat protein
MQWIKTALLTFALCLSFNAAALTDDEEAVWREAIVNGQMETVKKFVKADANIVNEQIFGWSPLQMATNAHQVKVVEYFIEKGADLNYIHPYANHTAFHLAAISRDTNLTTLLAKKGADVNIKLRNNLSLIQFFRDEGDQKMMDHLTSLGVKDDGCKGEWC